MRIAYFISPHGFGHAARACAVIEAIWSRSPGVRFELFTTTPRWFFEPLPAAQLGFHTIVTDLGLVQKSSLEEDLDETIRQLRAQIPFRPARVDGLAWTLDELGCDLVICDVAPLGLAVARACALPSILIENFTWDWIYRFYADADPEFGDVADELAEVFSWADLRIQTEPLCRAVDGSVRVPPISRARRSPRPSVRARLGVPESAPLVMVTMGGVEWSYSGLESRLDPGGSGDAPWLVIPGSSAEKRRCGRAILLPHRSGFHHPDLIHAADAVIGKLGYSTIAEIYQAGRPFGFVPRPTFPESPPLEAWVRRHLPSIAIAPESFVAWRWLETVDRLLALPPGRSGPPDGGAAVADHVLRRLASASPEPAEPAAADGQPAGRLGHVGS